MAAPHAARTSPRRTLLFSTLAIALALAVLLAVAELAFRIAGVDPRPLPLREVEVQAADGTWERVSVWGTSPLKRASPYPEVSMGEFIPDLDFRLVYFDRAPAGSAEEWNRRTVLGRINRYGLRGPEIEIPKPPDVYRVLAVGDSFTFGAGVADHETFAARLQALLADSPCVDAARAEVINGGVSGYNTADEVLYLERRWLPELQPDLVLLTFYVNDAYDDVRLADRMRGGALSGTGSALIWRSRFLGWLMHRVAAWRTARKTEALYRAQFSENPQLSGHNWDACRAALSRAARIVAERRARLALVIFPDLHGLEDDYPFEFIHREVRTAAAELGLPVLDLFDTFAGRDPTSLWVHPTDHHPNPAAHVLAAEAIAGFVCELSESRGR